MMYTIATIIKEFFAHSYSRAYCVVDIMHFLSSSRFLYFIIIAVSYLRWVCLLEIRWIWSSPLHVIAHSAS